jgi:SSS family solute:Na+ symporter
MLGLFLLGLDLARVNAAAATGTVVGFLVIVWMTISAKWPAALGQWSSPFHSFMITVVGTLAILLVGLLVSRLTPSVKVAMARADSQG